MAKFLIDTNIFLEILLAQDKSEKCKAFLKKENGNLCATDFTLHSIGVILFKLNQNAQFNIFLTDILPNVDIVSLPLTHYQNVSKISLKYKLDFDDAYQTAVSDALNLTVETMDKDFKKVAAFIKVDFLN